MNSLSYILFLLLPYFVYFSICYKLYGAKINIKNSVIYFIFGFIPVLLILTLYNFFPIIFEPVHFNSLQFIAIGIRELWVTGIIFVFIQVAFIEELSKLLSLKIGEGLIKKENCVFQTMFYSSMIACGFSYLENISYILREPTLLLSRMLLPSAMHILSGCIIGYFAGKLIELKNKNKSNFLNWLKTYFIGIITASTFHGIYNYSLEFVEPNANIFFMQISIFPINYGLIFLVGVLVNELYKKAFNFSSS